MYYHVKDHFKGREKPYDLLYKTLPEGLLYQLGKWLLHAYFFDSFYQRELEEKDRGEYRLWYFEDLINFLKFHGVSSRNRQIIEAEKYVAKVNALYVWFSHLTTFSGQHRQP